MSMDPHGFPCNFSTFVIQGLITSPQIGKKILVKNAVSKMGRVTVTCQGVQEPDYGHSQRISSTYGAVPLLIAGVVV